MANVCQCYEVRGCPASLYLRCEAYATGRNCWEAPTKPCCKAADLQRCRFCSVAILGQAMAESSAAGIES